MAYIDTKHGKLYYRIHGSGPIPLLLHEGLGRSLDYWLDFEKHLEKDFRVLLLDTRGLGKSEEAKLPWGLTIFDYADDVVQALDELGWDKAHMFGLSLGGMVTLALGIKYPERCLSVMSMNASIAGLKTVRMSPRGILLMAKTYLQKEKVVPQWQNLLINHRIPESSKAGITKKWEKIVSDVGLPKPEACAKQIIAALKFNPTEDLKQLQVPTAIIYGDRDFFVPYHNSIKIHSLIPQAELIRVHEAGHEAHVDQPEALAAVLRDFSAKAAGMRK